MWTGGGSNPLRAYSRSAWRLRPQAWKEGILGSISSLQPGSSFLPTLEVPLVYLGHPGKASVQNSL